MTDEERQRQMDFILTQQAQFAVAIQTLRESQARTDAQLAMYAETQSEFSQIAMRSIQALVDAQLRADERQAQADERQAQADERLARTDERLNMLINIVERHISEGHKNVG